MNLRVDLILESERRSASVINLRSIVRITSIVVPTIILLIVATFVVNSVLLTRRIADHEGIKASLEGPQKEAVNLRVEFEAHKKMAKELNTWKASVLPMKDCLVAIQECVPEQIQFQTLSFSETVGPFVKKKDQAPSRLQSISIDGQVVVSDAMTYINQLKEAIEKHPTLSNLVSLVEVTDFRAPDQGADAAPYLLFQIKATLNPRKMQ